ncbi:MAG: hypothetical protein ABIX12_15400 [Rubrivivax sp.]
MDEAPPPPHTLASVALQAQQLAAALESLVALRDELLRLHAQLETMRLMQRLRRSHRD